MRVAEFHTHCHKAQEIRDKTFVKVMDRCDAFRRPERFEKILLACEADARGRTGLEDRRYPQAGLFRKAFAAAQSIDTASIAENKEGAKIRDAIRKARIAAVRRVLSQSAP